MKRYLKSIHTRYMLTFMAIMILTIVILGIIITNIITNFTLDLKLKEMYESSVTVSSYFKLEKNDTELPQIKDEDGNLDKALENTLKTLFMISPQTGVLVFDADGKLILHAQKQDDGIDGIFEYKKGQMPQIIGSEALSKDFVERVYNHGVVSTNDNCDGYFSKEVYLYAKPIVATIEKPTEENTDETLSEASLSTQVVSTDSEEPELEDKLLGIIICYDAGDTEQDRMLKSMMGAIISTLVWIMVASLVAIYGVSYYSMKPLREIGRAAKSFSRGKYNVRVKVRGNDELAELADSFNKMAIAIESKDEMQKDFLSNVSHDLKTPMTTIAGFVDGILDGAIPPEKQDYYLNIIKNEVKRLSRLVTSLLDLSRLQSGERKFEFKQF